MKIVFLITNLSTGGAERVMVTLANELVKKHEIIIGTRSNRIKDFYYVNRDIKRINLLKSPKKLSNIFIRLIEIFNVILQICKLILKEKPDVVVSFLSSFNVLTILASKITKTSVIISERNNPSKEKIGKFKNFLRKIIYPFATLIVFQTKKASKYFTKILKRNIYVIPNPLTPDVKKIKTCSKKNIILAMGSLIYQKRFDILINSVALIKDELKKKNWIVEIYGEGKLKHALEKRIKKYKIEEIVKLKGKTDKPFEKMKKASIFLLTSDFEGFPNVLCEAMACGCVPISVDCNFGPKEIIKNKFNGILVKQKSKSISSELYRLINDKNKLKKMRMNTKIVFKRLDVSIIAKKWEKLFYKIKKNSL